MRGSVSAITIEIDDERLKRLHQAAREMNMTPAAAAARLLEEGLRLQEFPGIEFRDTDAGRQPYVAGIRMPLWHVAMVAREFGEDVSGIAQHLSIPQSSVEQALCYIRAYSAEIDAAIADIHAAADQLAATLPPSQVVSIA
jgi:hypothetical protein